MSLSIEEQETHISFMRGDKVINIYASDSMTITKMDKLVDKNPSEYKRVKETKFGNTYEMPISLLSFRTKSRKYTSEQKQVMAKQARMNLPS